MKSNSLLRSLALLAAIALAVPAFAKPLVKTINIPQAAKLGKAAVWVHQNSRGRSSQKIVMEVGCAIMCTRPSPRMKWLSLN